MVFAYCYIVIYMQGKHIWQVNSRLSKKRLSLTSEDEVSYFQYSYSQLNRSIIFSVCTWMFIVCSMWFCLAGIFWFLGHWRRFRQQQISDQTEGIVQTAARDFVDYTESSWCDWRHRGESQKVSSPVIFHCSPLVSGGIQKRMWWFLTLCHCAVYLTGQSHSCVGWPWCCWWWLELVSTLYQSDTSY